MIPLLIFLTLTAQVYSEDCVFNVSANTSPFIFDAFFKFPKKLTFSLEDVVYLACPEGTFSDYLSETGDHVACKGGTSILNVRTVEFIDFNDIKCVPNPTATVHKLRNKCENNRTLIEVGTEIYDHFVPVLSVCFDEVKLAPFYVKHNWRDYSLSVKSKTSTYNDIICPVNSYRCVFVDNGGVYENTNMDAIYDDQKTILKNLGVSTDVDLVKLPLAFNAFYMYPPQQIELYPYRDYLNSVPIWDSAFDDWILTYITITEYATVDVLYSGTLGVATALNGNNEEIELYLGDNKVPVPKFIWVVLETSTSAGVYIRYNYNSASYSNEVYDEICSNPFIIYSLVWCQFEDVTDPDLKAFIDNNILV